MHLVLHHMGKEEKKCVRSAVFSWYMSYQIYTAIRQQYTVKLGYNVIQGTGEITSL
jgi:hypothetical protein